jgi:hypothetical protein
MDGKVRDLTGAMGTVNGDQVTWENAPEVKQAPGQQRYNTVGQLEWDAKRLFNEKMGGKYNGAEGAVDALGRQAFDYRINSDPEF